MYVMSELESIPEIREGHNGLLILMMHVLQRNTLVVHVMPPSRYIMLYHFFVVFQCASRRVHTSTYVMVKVLSYTRSFLIYLL